MMEQELKPSAGALAAARELRIKIHGFNRGGEAMGVLNKANAEWLDSVCLDDARIIEKHIRADAPNLVAERDRLRAALRRIDTLPTNWLDDFERQARAICQESLSGSPAPSEDKRLREVNQQLVEALECALDCRCGDPGLCDECERVARAALAAAKEQ